jgi:tRNA (guanine26-N2/guanine27-N2)-dimethyltransferase
MKLKQIKEGKTKFFIPAIFEKPPTKKSPVFFNPDMELSRDISVGIAKILKPKNFCDSLAGCGARGLRIANEVKCKVFLNDKNPLASNLIKKNAKLNDLNPKITNLDANLFLSSLSKETGLQWIDIDPFGSPVRFIDSAFRSIEHNGILSITATDTAPLSGTYPKSCQRKYDAIPLRTDYYNELGLRIMIGFLAREALRYDKSLQILFSYSKRHYFRAYLKVKKSRREANVMLEKRVKFLQHCFNCLNREMKTLDELEKNCKCSSKFHNAGPLWDGKFAEERFCKKLIKTLEKENFRFKEEEIKLVKMIESEQKVANNLYYNIHKTFKKLKIPAKSMEDVTKKLKKRNFLVTRTHFSRLGIRTDAKIFDLYDFLKK